MPDAFVASSLDMGRFGEAAMSAMRRFGIFAGFAGMAGRRGRRRSSNGEVAKSGVSVHGPRDFRPVEGRSWPNCLS
jgi:hypothetical protein